ncbi:MAG: FadR family transcriptional regulator [Microbacterium sp.]|uniref:FadR/GntR family transcriptional regulator n=1 Tax=unclassified Microbacterium TaxID=2609290 RepID=UPI0008DA5C6C|nr:MULTISPECIES: FCD domain-containing protein [unclassified Microbacterium]MAY49447.1 FadR family transcriptional regulator [Microbacterium sp.]HBS75301.1 FadR family transcriptional regulator [Microbacterium sp.]
MAEPSTPAPSRAWQIVLEKIENDLLEGRLGPGDRLPAERELAGSLGVGRSSVREALRVLEVMGLIRTGTGSGPASGAIIVAAPTGGMQALLRLQVAAQGFPLHDVVRTRLALEEAVVDTLARDPDRSIRESRRVMAAMAATDLTPGEFLALDAQLHLSLAEASGNVVISAMMAGLRTSIESYVRRGADNIDDWDATAARLRDEHAEILAAVDDGDPARARRLVNEHISGYYAHAGLSR